MIFISFIWPFISSIGVLNIAFGIIYVLALFAVIIYTAVKTFLPFV